MTVETTRTTIARRLRELLVGERTEEAEKEAEQLLEAYDVVEEPKKPPRRPEPTAAERAAAERAEEDAKWRRLIGGGGMSTRIWSPGGRDYEPAWTQQNEAKTYLRNRSPWRD
jgi:hypothetical protein